MVYKIGGWGGVGGGGGEVNHSQRPRSPSFIKTSVTAMQFARLHILHSPLASVYAELDFHDTIMVSFTKITKPTKKKKKKKKNKKKQQQKTNKQKTRNMSI